MKLIILLVLIASCGKGVVPTPVGLINIQEADNKSGEPAPYIINTQCDMYGNYCQDHYSNGIIRCYYLNRYVNRKDYVACPNVRH